MCVEEHDMTKSNNAYEIYKKSCEKSPDLAKCIEEAANAATANAKAANAKAANAANAANANAANAANASNAANAGKRITIGGGKKKGRNKKL